MWEVGESSVAYRMFGNNGKNFKCDWHYLLLTETKSLSLICGSVLKGIWNNSKLIACRYCYFVIFIFFSGLIEPFILHAVLCVRSLGRAPLGGLSAWFQVGQRGRGDDF